MTLDAVPPGQHPTRITPIASSVGNENNLQSSHARNGMIVNCAKHPVMMSLGRVKTSLKSAGFSVSPIPNITIPKRGLIALVLIQMQDDGTKRARAETATMIMVM